jgi:hypothetical protein
MFLFPWLFTAIALIGAWHNSWRRKEGFYYWLVSNTGFCIYNAIIGEVAMCLLFAVYLGITINGLRKWK